MDRADSEVSRREPDERMVAVVLPRHIQPPISNRAAHCARNERGWLAEVLDRHRLDRIGELEAEDARVKVELRLQGALDVLAPSEAVLLPLERKIRHRQALLA